MSVINLDPSLRLEKLEEKLDISISSIYRRIKDQTLPAPIKLGRCSLWSEIEVDFAIENKRLMTKDEKKTELERRERLYYSIN